MMQQHHYHLRSGKNTKKVVYYEYDTGDAESDASETESDAEDMEEDPEWHPAFDEDASEEDASEEDASEEDASEEDASEDTHTISIAELGRMYRQNWIQMPSRPQPMKKQTSLTMSPDEKKYYNSLSPEEKKVAFERYQSLLKDAPVAIPFRFKLLRLPSTIMSDASKRYLMNTYHSFQSMNEDHGEYTKYAKWFESIQRIPFGNYHCFFKQEDKNTAEQMGQILSTIRTSLDAVIADHSATKDQLMLQLAQWISNPESKGKCIGIQGPMGIGKTTLMKEGVSKTLGIPFGFLPLGGAGDASFLEGHAFTYEGGTYGRIVELLIKLQVMNPILFFDELDKVADSAKGEEVISVLTHLTDASQNHHFTDKYFGDIEIDVSRCLMVFTFNDESKIHPILKDRMQVLRLKGYTASQKLNIARRHLIPKLFQQYRWEPDAITIDDSVLQCILSKTPEEEGVRNLIRSLESVFGWVNMAQFIVVAPFKERLVFPFVLQESHLAFFLPPVESFSSGDVPTGMYI